MQDGTLAAVGEHIGACALVVVVILPALSKTAVAKLKID